MKPEIAGWLLAGDVSVQYQTRRDLLGEDRPDLQARIATEGWGARILAARNPDTSWGRRFYNPKWTNSHYTLLDLRNLCLPRDNQAARDSVAHILATEKRADGGIGPGSLAHGSDVCVNGMFLNYAAWFGAPEPELHAIIDFVLGEWMPDGGFNCDSTRGHPHHSSLHTTISVLEGFQQLLRSGYTYRADEIREAMASSREFILLHRFYRSDHTGEIIQKSFLSFPVSPRWKYNILRALDYFAQAGIPYDPRMQDALEFIRGKQKPDGLWNANAAHSGAVHFEMEKAGHPSRVITLSALRVLQTYGANIGT
ncbi:MAG: hypothetical protein H6874_12440 [Hyphomicrobiaceae bacterium]|nr:hypothetical protein [Hyphomicrobiaceae bacterium]